MEIHLEMAVNGDFELGPFPVKVFAICANVR
jgi:hypothetical protein